MRGFGSILLVVGCTGSEPTDLPCDQRSLADCESDAACRVEEGIPLQDDGTGAECLDLDEPGIPLACFEADIGCGDAETIAGEPGSETLYWFPSTCIPNGFDVANLAVEACP